MVVDCYLQHTKLTTYTCMLELYACTLADFEFTPVFLTTTDRLHLDYSLLNVRIAFIVTPRPPANRLAAGLGVVIKATLILNRR